MSLVELRVTEFLNKVDSNEPAPGGGSVSALAASLGVSLTRMVGHLTVPKKTFKAFDETVQKQVFESLEKLSKYKQELIELVDKDTNAFNEIMKAFKLPKSTREEKTVRREAIQDATELAIQVPYQVASTGLKALKECDIFIKYGNQNCLSDVAVGALMLEAGIEGSLLNVLINLGMFKDEEKVAFYKTEVERIKYEAIELRVNYLDAVTNTLV